MPAVGFVVEQAVINATNSCSPVHASMIIDAAGGPPNGHIWLSSLAKDQVID